MAISRLTFPLGKMRGLEKSVQRVLPWCLGALYCGQHVEISLDYLVGWLPRRKPEIQKTREALTGRLVSCRQDGPTTTTVLCAGSPK